MPLKEGLSIETILWPPGRPRINFFESSTSRSDNRDYLLASEQTQQSYNFFELLFGTFEELIVSSNVSTGVSNGSGSKVSQLGFLVSSPRE